MKCPKCQTNMKYKTTDPTILIYPPPQATPPLWVCPECGYELLAANRHLQGSANDG